MKFLPYDHKDRNHWTWWLLRIGLLIAVAYVVMELFWK